MPPNFEIVKSVPQQKKVENHWSKVLENIVHNRLYSFLSQLNVFCDLQFGFKKITLLAMPML